MVARAEETSEEGGERAAETEADIGLVSPCFKSLKELERIKYDSWNGLALPLLNLG